MDLPVYDFRTDIRNILVTPQIRSRFLQLEPGVATDGHTHDLGHEVFLVLQGRAVFDIGGRSAEVGPGQMCVALADEMHSIRVISQEPVIMYLSVTPHIHPTHTMWDQSGNRLPHRFAPPGAYDVDPDESQPIDRQVDAFVQAATALSKAASSAADEQAMLAPRLKRALAEGDDTAARDTRDAMWDALFPIFERAHKLADDWNDLAPRAGTSP